MNCAELLNEVAVKGDEMVDLFAQADWESGTEPDYVKLVGTTYVGEFNRGFAVYFRINALIDFLSSDQAKGWLALPNGIPRPGVLELSAREPLVERDADWPAFDNSHFQQALLCHVEPDCCA